MTSRPLYRHADLRRIFRPERIAIVGATPNGKSFAGRVLENLRGYSGEVLLVNPKYQEVNGQRCFPSLKELPSSPDCVLIGTGRDTVEPLVRECADVGAGGVVLFASGFAETGKPETVREQRHLVQVAQAHGMRLLGPNSIGFANFTVNANLSFVDLLPRALPLPPHAIGVASQSGALAFALEQGMRHGIDFSHVLCCGNASDVDVADQVAFLAEEPSCAAIACIFEGLDEPQRLIVAAHLCADVGKPLVVYKVARSSIGRAAALSHTGSLAGSNEAYAAAFRAAGIVEVDALDELLEATLFFGKAPSRPKADGVIIVSSSGGAGIVAADAAEVQGVALPQPSVAATAVLSAVIPEFGSARNPCDLTAQVASDEAMIAKCAGVLLESEAYGAVVTPLMVTGDVQVRRFQVFNDLARQHEKIACGLWLSEWNAGVDQAHAMPKLALFRTASNCFRTIAAWHARTRWLQQRGQPRPARLSQASAATQAAALIGAAGHDVLTEGESKSILALYGVPVVGEVRVHDESAAISAADACGYPVVLKIESPDIPHKTAAGVVRLNLRTPAEVAVVYQELMANALRVTQRDRIRGVLVQSQVPAGVEFFVGARIDPQLGALLVVGTGGVLTELIRDTASIQAPCSVGEAHALLRQLRGYALLEGFRGGEGADAQRLAEVVARLSEFAADQKALVREFDVNPIICKGDRIVAVDALLVRRTGRSTDNP